MANATDEKQGVGTASGVAGKGNYLHRVVREGPEVVSRRPSKSRGRTERHLCSQIF